MYSRPISIKKITNCPFEFVMATTISLPSLPFSHHITQTWTPISYISYMHIQAYHSWLKILLMSYVLYIFPLAFFLVLALVKSFENVVCSFWSDFQSVNPFVYQPVTYFTALLNFCGRRTNLMK